MCRNWQLFIDRGIIARETGFTRVAQHPRPSPHLLEERLLPGLAFADSLPVHANGAEICLLFRMFNSDPCGFRIAED